MLSVKQIQAEVYRLLYRREASVVVQAYVNATMEVQPAEKHAAITEYLGKFMEEIAEGKLNEIMLAQTASEWYFFLNF